MLSHVHAKAIAIGFIPPTLGMLADLDRRFSGAGFCSMIFNIRVSSLRDRFEKQQRPDRAGAVPSMIPAMVPDATEASAASRRMWRYTDI